MIWFDYISIELAEKTTEELRHLNLLGVLPLFILRECLMSVEPASSRLRRSLGVFIVGGKMRFAHFSTNNETFARRSRANRASEKAKGQRIRHTLSKDGKTYEVLDKVIMRLDGEHEKDLLALTRLFADRIFSAEKDQAWLIRRFAMLRDIEDTPTYQRLIKKGIEQGREEGRVEGLEQGRAEGMRQAAIDLVLARFPEWRSLARRQLALITDLKVLQQVVIQMGSAKTAREAKEYLFDLEPPESETDE